jgi:putative ABC transport system ATP-binding protein
MERLIIRTKDLTKVYEMGSEEVHALKGVNLEIERGEYVAIMGPSGSGKSTLMNLIGCLDSATSGEYWLNERAVSDLSDDDLARVRNEEVGFVFQSFHLLPRYTAIENVQLPLVYSNIPHEERIARAKQALEAVDLTDRMHHRPNQLSGGQRQRVAIARALINHPSILLADEPTGNLDSKTGIEILALFDKLHQAGNTIIIVTHESDVAAHAHRMIHLRDGKIESDERAKNSPLAQPQSRREAEKKLSLS